MAIRFFRNGLHREIHVVNRVKHNRPSRWVQETKGTMALNTESARRVTETVAAVSDPSAHQEKRRTRVETRVHQRQCVKCRRWFWAWDPVRTHCFVCDAPPLDEVKRILTGIHATTG